MRKSFFAFVLLLSPLLSKAQWKATFDQGMKLYNSAKEIGKNGDVTETQRQERANLYIAANDKFYEAKKLGASIAPRTTVLAAQCIYNAAQDLNTLGKGRIALSTLESAFLVWPELNEVSEKEFTKELSTFDNGQNWVYPAMGTKEEWEEAYYSNHSFAARLWAFELKNNAEAEKHASMVMDNAKLAYYSIIEAANVMAYIHKQKDDCEWYEYAVKGLEMTTLYKPRSEEEKTLFTSNLISLSQYIPAPDKCLSSELRANLYQRAGIAYNKYYPTADLSGKAYEFGKLAYDGGARSNELFFALAESSHRLSKRTGEKLATDDNPDPQKWLKLIEERAGSFSSQEWNRLIALYDMMGLQEKKKEAERNQYKKSGWEDTHFAFSTNPWNYIQWKQILVAFDLMLPRTSHEIRFVQHSNTPNYFQNDVRELGDPFFLKLHYTGTSLSYTLKVMRQSEKYKWFYAYVGPQVRYEQRTYKPLDLPRYNNDNKTEPKDTFNVYGKSQRADLCMIFGSQARAKRFFVDYYVGFGIGYKTMQEYYTGDPKNLTWANQEFTDNYEIFDPRYRPAKWNKVYIPTRAGIRVGIILK
jgi:hypothetical protein